MQKTPTAKEIIGEGSVNADLLLRLLFILSNFELLINYNTPPDFALFLGMTEVTINEMINFTIINYD